MAILLVVADDALRKEWFEVLHGEGHRVTAVGSEDDAQRYLRSFTPALVVYRASANDQVVQRFLYDVSGHESGPQISVLVLCSSPEASRLAESCGFDTLCMPVDETSLCSEVSRLAPPRRSSSG